MAFIHGAFLVFIDAIGSGSSWSGLSFSLEAARKACLAFLLNQTGPFEDFGKHEIVWNDPLKFGITPFVIERGNINFIIYEFFLPKFFESLSLFAQNLFKEIFSFRMYYEESKRL